MVGRGGALLRTEGGGYGYPCVRRRLGGRLEGRAAPRRLAGGAQARGA